MNATATATQVKTLNIDGRDVPINGERNLLEVIRNGLVLAQVNSYWQQTLVGVIIILAVLVDRIRSRIN